MGHRYHLAPWADVYSHNLNQVMRVEVGRQRPEPSVTAGSQLAWLTDFPSPRSMECARDPVTGGAPCISTCLRPSPEGQPTPGPAQQPRVQSPPRRTCLVWACRLCASATPAACVHCPSAGHVLRGPASPAHSVKQLLILLAGVLAPLASPVKMKESFRNKSSDSSGERKSILAREQPASSWLFVSDSQGQPLGSGGKCLCPRPLSSGASGGRGACVVLPPYLLFIHSSIWSPFCPTHIPLLVFPGTWN